MVVCPCNQSRRAGTELTSRPFKSDNSTLSSMAAAMSPGECPLCCSPTWWPTPDCLLGTTSFFSLAGVPCSPSLGEQILQALGRGLFPAPNSSIPAGAPLPCLPFSSGALVAIPGWAGLSNGFTVCPPPPSFHKWRPGKWPPSCPLYRTLDHCWSEWLLSGSFCWWAPARDIGSVRPGKRPRGLCHTSPPHLLLQRFCRARCSYRVRGNASVESGMTMLLPGIGAAS